MHVESAVTSLSWIPSEAVTGYMKAGFTLHLTPYDDPPPDRVSDAEVQADAHRVRFANKLWARAEFAADGALVAHHVDGGLVMGRTTAQLGPLGASFAAVGMPVLRAEPETGLGWVRFRQTCGGRTASPLPRKVPRPPFVRLQSPLVWTTLELTLHADGRAEQTLAGASPFPRHWVYDGDGKLIAKSGLTDWAGWTAQNSQLATPWGHEDSPVVVTAAETALERYLSTLIMRGGQRPVVRRLPAKAVLTRQGEPADELLLLLDGVVSIDVSGSVLAELGPGAILGERAILEGGRRTATVTALTPIRVACAALDAIDAAALATVAAGHHREETR